jgi:phosphate butyryltransferase
MDRTHISTLDDLLRAAAAAEPAVVLLVMPKNVETVAAVARARSELSTRFILVGNREQIDAALAGAGLGPGPGLEVRHHPAPADALAASVKILRQKEASILMKGSIDTGTMMRAVFSEDSGLRTGKVFSDVAITELPPASGGRLLMITDGGLTPAPGLKEKIALIENAVAVAHALGNPLPRVALLSATELVSARIPSTTEAAILSKMNDRGQIAGCLVDGPLALDNAVSPEAAREKGIRSEVAGRADIIVAPSIEAANALAKSATYFAGWRLAHVVVGGTVPILIPSRADTAEMKLLSIALGTLMAAANGR